MQEDNAPPLIRIDTARQTLELSAGGNTHAVFPVSTSPLGLGVAEGSLRTPPGRFLIVEKIGHGLPLDTVFKGRLPVRDRKGAAAGPDDDLVVARVLRLHGLDTDNANTLERFIYIHGTNHPEKIGRPAGSGCVRMRPEDVAALFEQTPVGAEVAIT